MSINRQIASLYLLIAMATSSTVFGQVASKYAETEPTIKGLVIPCWLLFDGSETDVINVRHLRTNTCTTVDERGYFELIVPEYADSTEIVFQSLRNGTQVRKVAINKKEIQKILYCPRIITMHTVRPIRKSTVNWAAATNIIIDYPRWSFSPYAEVLGAENANLLHDTLAVMAPLGFNMYFNRFDFDFNFGFRSLETENGDIYRKVKRKLYALRFGYQVVRLENFRVVPYLGVRLQRWRLINADKRIHTLDGYLDQPEIDLRINQFAAEYGLRAVFAVRDIPGWPFPTLQIGVFGTYLQPLHDAPVFRSKSNRLDVDRPLDLNPWLFGLFFGLLVD